MSRIALAAACVLSGCAALPATQGLEGTSWQLVRFQGGDGTVLVPEEPSRYTLAFGADGVLSARIDCNRGRGGWKSAEKGRLEIGVMAITRAQCAPGSLHDEVVRRLPYVRTYMMNDGHLFISLMADGGTFELEPTR